MFKQKHDRTLCATIGARGRIVIVSRRGMAPYGGISAGRTQTSGLEALSVAQLAKDGRQATLAPAEAWTIDLDEGALFPDSCVVNFI